MNQEGVRKRLIKYCEQNGVKYVYIAEKLHLSKTTVSHFIKNRDMRKSNYDNLVSFLKRVNYL